MTKKRKEAKPQLLLHMIVAGMSLLIMIFAAAGYAAARFEFGVSHKQQRVGLVRILIGQPTLYTNRWVCDLDPSVSLNEKRATKVWLLFF